jgi:hypothetical protein
VFADGNSRVDVCRQQVLWAHVASATIQPPEAWVFEADVLSDTVVVRRCERGPRFMMFIVRRRHFALMVGGLVLLVALISGGAWLTLHAEREELESTIARAAIQKARLLRENKAIDEQREALSRQLAMLKRSAQVKSRAYSQVDAQLGELQREILELKEDVAFYRGIVSEDSKRNGVQLQRLVLERDGAPQDYLFRVVLTCFPLTVIRMESGCV